MSAKLPCDSVAVKAPGKPDAGHPHVRFDEGGADAPHGLRILSHNRGNPDTEVGRRLTGCIRSSTLPVPEV
jgi:hypothetical protein